MFRFDSFKKSTANTTNTNDTTQDPLNNNDSPTFLQRIASSDSILGANKQRPTLSKNSLLNMATSFSIPMPTNSWGMLALSRLQDEQDDELDAIVHLLLNKDKAIKKKSIGSKCKFN